MMFGGRRGLSKFKPESKHPTLCTFISAQLNTATLVLQEALDPEDTVWVQPELMVLPGI